MEKIIEPEEPQEETINDLNIAMGGKNLLGEYTNQDSVLLMIKKYPALDQLAIYFSQDYILNYFDDRNAQSAYDNFMYSADLIRNSMKKGELTAEIDGLLNSLSGKFAAMLRRSHNGFERIMQQTQISQSNVSNTSGQSKGGWLSKFPETFRRVMGRG